MILPINGEPLGGKGLNINNYILINYKYVNSVAVLYNSEYLQWVMQNN